jgi:hypothetical protein
MALAQFGKAAFDEADMQCQQLDLPSSIRFFKEIPT